jgi:hypothetical protein
VEPAYRPLSRGRSCRGRRGAVLRGGAGSGHDAEYRRAPWKRRRDRRAQPDAISGADLLVYRARPANQYAHRDRDCNLDCDRFAQPECDELADIKRNIVSNIHDDSLADRLQHALGDTFSHFDAHHHSYPNRYGDGNRDQYSQRDFDWHTNGYTYSYGNTDRNPERYTHGYSHSDCHFDASTHSH